MNVITLSKRKFANLEKYEIPAEVTNTEGQLFVIHDHEKWENKRYLLKRLYIDEGATFGNKLLTVNTLIDSRDDIGIEELVLPEKLAIVNDKVVGFTIPLIEPSVNLSCLLNNYDVPRQSKIEYLKQVGDILKKVQHVEKFKNNFFLGDIHEANFIVEKENNRVHAIDIDSCKIGSNQPFSAKYLAANVGADSLPKKYPLNEYGISIPNTNTEWFCYNMMVLNFIANGPVYKMKLDEYYLYLQYLRDLGFSDELIDSFTRLYANCDNNSPRDFLDEIPENMHLASYNVFKYKIKKMR